MISRLTGPFHTIIHLYTRHNLSYHLYTRHNLSYHTHSVCVSDAPESHNQHSHTNVTFSELTSSAAAPKTTMTSTMVMTVSMTKAWPRESSWLTLVAPSPPAPLSGGARAVWQRKQQLSKCDMCGNVKEMAPILVTSVTGVCCQYLGVNLEAHSLTLLLYLTRKLYNGFYVLLSSTDNKSLKKTFLCRKILKVS